MTGKRVVVVGGGTAGLVAAYTLKKRGIEAVVLEAEDQPGGRLGGHVVDGFTIDGGADFFPTSHDVALRLCDELNLPLLHSAMNMVIYRNGKFVVTKAGQSLGAMIHNLVAFAKLRLLTPRSIAPSLRLARDTRRDRAYLSFGSDSRLAEIAGDETFGDYLTKIGATENMRVLIAGFLEMTMGDVYDADAEYLRTYIADILMKPDRLAVPEEGASALARALAEACGDALHVSTPVQRVNIENGTVTGVSVEGHTFEPHAVIVAVPAVKVSAIIPDLPVDIRRTLDDITYSAGCRVVIGLDKPPLPPGWNAVLYPEDETPLMLDRSLNLPKCVPEGKSTLDLLVGRDRARELNKLDDETIKREMLKAAREKAPPGSNLPADDEGIISLVYRWEQALCMPDPGMFAAVDGMKSALNEHVDNLFLSGDYMGVPSVNGALSSGVRAAEQAADLLAERAQKR